MFQKLPEWSRGLREGVAGGLAVWLAACAAGALVHRVHHLGELLGLPGPARRGVGLLRHEPGDTAGGRQGKGDLALEDAAGVAVLGVEFETALLLEEAAAVLRTDGAQAVFSGEGGRRQLDEMFLARGDLEASLAHQRELPRLPDEDVKAGGVRHQSSEADLVRVLIHHDAESFHLPYQGIANLSLPAASHLLYEVGERGVAQHRLGVEGTADAGVRGDGSEDVGAVDGSAGPGAASEKAGVGGGGGRAGQVGVPQQAEEVRVGRRHQGRAEERLQHLSQYGHHLLKVCGFVRVQESVDD